jgi:aminoglycoside phosphotransferase family enzyme/predicted kinase
VTQDDSQDLKRLVLAIRDSGTLGHPTDDSELLETHLSFVLLAGDYAYKFKKPVDLGFADFSTLEKRRLCCEEELRLNKRLAPDLYLAVVAVYGSPESPSVGGAGSPIEYAVKMRRFDRSLQFDLLREQGRLLPAYIDDLCDRVAAFHASAERAPADSEFGTPETLMRPVRENFLSVDTECSEASVLELNGHLRDVAESEWRRLRWVFDRRKSEGRIRECHGDMHLANIALSGDRALIFDCLEFNARLRWIDVISEVAFTLMDLDFGGGRELSSRFLSRYLEHTGDYEGLEVLRFYQMYRAMVRAKVAAIRAVQLHGKDASDKTADAESLDYLWLAERYSESAGTPVLVLMHGLSGSGKSYVAERLVEALGAVRVRSDVERKRMAAFAPSEPEEEGLYASSMTQKTYARLAQLASTCVANGFPAIVDATFLLAEHRKMFLDEAVRAKVPAVIVEVTASNQTMTERIARRSDAGGDPSDATPAVLEMQMGALNPLSSDERLQAVSVDTDSALDVADLATRIATNAGGT